MKYCAGCGLACCSGCERTEASQLSAFRRRGRGSQRDTEDDERRETGYWTGLHGVGSHFVAPSASFLKCVLVMKS
jgi:hypothetical protein